MSKIIVDQIEGLSSQLVTFNDGISVTGSVSISGQNALTNAIASLQNDTDNNRIVITDSLGNVSYLDLSSYLDDTNDFVTAAALDTVTGVLTLTRNSGSEITVDIGYDTLQSNIDAEESARTVADAALQANIDNEASIRGAADTALQANIDAEEAARISADNTLQSNIDTEASTRAAADIVLQDNIDAEEAARISADTTLQTNIDTEASTRAAADTVLQNNIDAEEAARIAADTILQSNIDSEATARSNADTTLQNNITSEETDRIAADAALQAQIDATGSNLSNYQLLSEKGQPNGYAGLDPSGLVPAAQLPSFVDDVIEVANFASLPGTGETGKIYVTIDSGDVYRWSGSAYIQINDAVSSADQATKLATARSFTLSGDVTSSPVNFDGSGNVILNASVPQGAVTQHQSALAITQSQITDLTFPPPNNATITLEGGTGITTSIGSFTTNQGTNETLNISHGDTSNLSGSYGGIDPVIGPTSIKGITVDGFGHVTAIDANPLVGSGDGIIMPEAQAPPGYDFGYYFDMYAFSQFLGSPSDTVQIQLSGGGLAFDAVVVGGSNITVAEGNVINLEPNIALTGVTAESEIKVVNPMYGTMIGMDAEYFYHQDDIFGTKYKANSYEIRLQSLEGIYEIDRLYVTQNKIKGMINFPNLFNYGFSLESGFSDSSFGHTPNSVTSRVSLGSNAHIPAGFIYQSPQFWGMVESMASPPNSNIAQFLGGFKPFAFDNYSLGGFLIEARNASGGGPTGLLMAGGYTCGEDTYGGGYTAMPYASLYDWWTITPDYNAGGGRFWFNGYDQGLLAASPSDYRVKQNINKISEGAIDRVKQLKPVSFNWKTTDKFGWKNEEVAKEGFIAHEVQEVIPSGATGEKDGDNIQQLELDSIVAVLTKAVQEQQEIIETLQSEIELLKAK